MEETVMGKAFLHENEEGSFLCYGCEAESKNGVLYVKTCENTKELVYSLKKRYLFGSDVLEGFGIRT
jgi:hypothetical protein